MTDFMAFLVARSNSDGFIHPWGHQKEHAYVVSPHPRDYRGPHSKTSGSSGNGRCQHVTKYFWKSAARCTADCFLFWNGRRPLEESMIWLSDGLGHLTVICILNPKSHNIYLYNISYFPFLNKESDSRELVHEIFFAPYLEQRMLTNCTWVQ